MARPGRHGQQPLDCDLCGKTLKDRSGLTGHLRLAHGVSAKSTSQQVQVPTSTSSTPPSLEAQQAAVDSGKWPPEWGRAPFTGLEFEWLQDMIESEFELDDPRVQELLRRCDAHCDGNAKSVVELAGRITGIEGQVASLASALASAHRPGECGDKQCRPCATFRQKAGLKGKREMLEVITRAQVWGRAESAGQKLFAAVEDFQKAGEPETGKRDDIIITGRVEK